MINGAGVVTVASIVIIAFFCRKYPHQKRHGGGFRLVQSTSLYM